MEKGYGGDLLMINEAARNFRDIADKVKDVNDYIPSFLKKDKSLPNANIFESACIKREGLTDFQIKMLKEEYGYSEGEIADIHSWEDVEKKQKIQDYIDGKIEFDEVKVILADAYATAVNSNRPWTWSEAIPDGEKLTARQKKEIREEAREKGLVPIVPTYEKDGKIYADFSEYKIFEGTLKKEDWNKTDEEQFKKCNQMLKTEIEKNPDLAKQFTKEQVEQIKKGDTPSGFTWHHSEKSGTMQLVPYGVHNSTNHCGGRSEGSWADFPRH